MMSNQKQPNNTLSFLPSTSPEAKEQYKTALEKGMKALDMEFVQNLLQAEIVVKDEGLHWFSHLVFQYLNYYINSEVHPEHINQCTAYCFDCFPNKTVTGFNADTEMFGLLTMLKNNEIEFLKVCESCGIHQLGETHTLEHTFDYCPIKANLAYKIAAHANNYQLHEWFPLLCEKVYFDSKYGENANGYDQVVQKILRYQEGIIKENKEMEIQILYHKQDTGNPKVPHLLFTYDGVAYLLSFRKLGKKIRSLLLLEIQEDWLNQYILTGIFP